MGDRIFGEKKVNTEGKIPTGSKILDFVLGGGYEKDVITTLYGPAGSGKTVLCMLCAASMARTGRKVVYLDTENNFSFERLKQIAQYDYEKVINNIVFLRPVSFAEQKGMFGRLKELVNKHIGLVAVDTIGSLYRLELGTEQGTYAVNKEFGRQISFLQEITRKKNIPVLVANQVYADFEDKQKVKMVGGDILRYASKCLIEVIVLASGNRKAIVRKHRSIKSGKEMAFTIVQGGILGVKEGKGFFR
ncbi:DNA repair and recombination protein RadB [Candidatus Woesearchaeota archaeon]|nr:DNA repair and recombination protein RadB [Candidatus Woesearchaeota archaeon]